MVFTNSGVELKKCRVAFTSSGVVFTNRRVEMSNRRVEKNSPGLVKPYSANQQHQPRERNENARDVKLYKIKTDFPTLHTVNSSHTRAHIR